MGQRFYVITYRTGGKVYFFRGGTSYKIVLSKIEGNGWVEEIGDARIFVRPPDFTAECIHSSLDGKSLGIHFYYGPVLHTQIVRPTKRPDGYRKRYKPGPVIEPQPKKKK